jgi:Bardet-Biedl syndrome 2 protein
MLSTIYHFELNHPIVNNLACLGKYDGVNTSMCFATVGGKVVIYSPHEKENNDVDYLNMTTKTRKDIQILNLNKEVTAIGFGQGDPKSPKEFLFIGSPSSLMCYDVLNNKTIFNKDVMDGVYCIATGNFSNYTCPLCIVGGNCSLQGFDIQGDEKFWTVSGGNTQCLSLNDVDDDCFYELIVGTDDFAIRIYKNENNISEINENTKIVLIHSIANSKFIYGLENGTIGLYERGERIWKKKEKGYITSCISADFNNDGVEELICGLSTGKIQIRSENNGEVLFELELKFPISKLLFGDMNNSGNSQIICILNNGDVIGYTYKPIEKFNNLSDVKIVAKDSKVDKEELAKYEKLLSDRVVMFYIICRNY